jgi:peptidyl-dipeptidase Dcp
MLSTTTLAAAAPAPSSPAAAAGNPLLAPWAGSYGGVPPFGRIEVEHFGPALDAALAERRAEIAAIKADPAPPTFANTIEALERAGATYVRVASMFYTYASSMKTDAFAAIEREWAPKLAAANDEVLLDGELFARVEAVYRSPEREKLGPEQARLLWRAHDNFVRLGARLTPEQKQRLSAINQQLAGLYTEFAQKVLADEDSWIVLDSTEQLAGLPESFAASLQEAAKERGLDGKWAVVNTRSVVDPFLTYSSHRDLRERVWKAFKNRGDNGNANDTNATISRILPLRAEKARLLGFPTFADWKLGNKMATTPQRAQALMATVWKPAVARVREEVAALQEVARRESPGLVIEPWDYLYYAEKVRKEKYDIDQAELKPYFQLDEMIEASFWMANKLYGLSFTEVTGKVPVFHPEVRVWEVRDGEELVGLFYGDYFARPGKNSGAWENAYRSQAAYPERVLPLVSNNNNFVKGKPGEPVLISLDDAETLFHEFGHALHDLLSDVTYQSLAGTNTATDFVEFPSQVHEHWVLTPEILDRFARHVETGQPMPKALLDKVRASSTFNQGYVTLEYLSAAIVDMDLHAMADPKDLDPDAFERDTLGRIGMPKEVAMRHRLPQFNHLFSGEGYAAGYYSYLWSDTMGADAWAAFEETGDPWNPRVAARMKALMAAGDSIDQTELYRKFRGRDPEVSALLAERGFPAGK